MAEKSEETGRGDGWLAALYAQLKTKVQEAADRLDAEAVADSAGAERVARAAGVIARSAKVIDDLRLRALAHSEEDEMGERSYDPDEDERIRRELLAEGERLDRILEIKRSEGRERRATEAAQALGAAGAAPGPS